VSKFILINAVRLGAVGVLTPGTQFDDAVDPTTVATVRANGGVLYPDIGDQLTAAAEIARSMKASGVATDTIAAYMASAFQAQNSTLGNGSNAQLVFYVDPVKGKDSNPGTQALPVQRIAQLWRLLVPTGMQLPPGASSAAYAINVLSKPLADDRPIGTMRVGFGCTLDWNAGSTTINYTGSITAVTPAATPGTNTSPDLTDAALTGGTWAGFPTQRGRVPSGVRAGAIFYGQHDLGGARTRTAKAIIPDPNVINQISKLPTLAIADPIVIESLMQVEALPMDYDIDDSADTTFIAKVRFNNFQFNNMQLPTNKTQFGLGFYGCIFATSAASSSGVGSGSSANFFGCLFTKKIVSPPGSSLWLVACSLLAGLTVTPGSIVILDGDTCSDSAAANDSIENTGGFLQLARCSSYGSISIPGIRCYGDTLVTGTGLFGSTACYGSGNANVGMHCRSGHTVLYSTIPTITGANNDVVVGKQASQTWASFATNGALDVLTNAAIVKT
jgi:hypothetical protein